MARKVRIFIKDTAQHVLLKSLDSIVLFQNEQDYQTFKAMLEELTQNYSIAIHSYILMPHYFEFLTTPAKAESLSKFMQSLGRKYVGYFNKKYNRKGTLWESRYKASLIEDQKYLFDIMKYIETKATQEHKYSSLQKNLFNKPDAVVSQHTLYKKLAYTDKERVKKYAKIFYTKQDAQKAEFIKNCLQKQLVTGTREFIKEIEQKVGIALISKERGRPKKEITKQRKKMYKNLKVLDKEQHKNLKISPLKDLSFAKDVSFIPLIANEVGMVGATFPVVFTADENPSLVALVSLGGENLAINKEEKWVSSYIPAYLRRYPFSLGSTKENPDQKVILIDEEANIFSKTKGKQLFKKDGSQSETLENAIKFLTAYDKDAVMTLNAVKLISESGILEEREISVGEGEEKKVLVQGFRVVNRQKLNELSDDILADWVRKGIITLIDAHLKSLDNIQTLFNIAQQRQN